MGEFHPKPSAKPLMQLASRASLGSANDFKGLADCKSFGVQHVSNKRLQTAVDNSSGPTFGRAAGSAETRPHAGLPFDAIVKDAARFEGAVAICVGIG